MTVFSQSHWSYLVRLNESLIRVKILHKETGRNFVYQESKWSRMTCIWPPSNAWATATSERLVASILPGYKFSYSYGWYIKISRNKMLWLTPPFLFENTSILTVLSSILFDEPTIWCGTIFLCLWHPLLFFPCSTSRHNTNLKINYVKDVKNTFFA